MKKLVLLLLLTNCHSEVVYTDCRTGNELCRNNKVYRCAPNSRYVMRQDCTIITPNVWECQVVDAGVATCRLH